MNLMENCVWEFDCIRCKKESKSVGSVYQIKPKVYICNDCGPKWSEYYNHRLDESIKYFSNPKNCKHKILYNVWFKGESIYDSLKQKKLPYSKLSDEQKESLDTENNGGTNPLLVQDCDESCKQ